MRIKIVVTADVSRGTLLTAAKDAEDLEEELRGSPRAHLWGSIADGLRAAADRVQKNLDGAEKVRQGQGAEIKGQKEGPEEETET